MAAIVRFGREPLENLLDESTVFLHRLWVNEHIVHVSKDAHVDEVAQDCVGYSLKGRWSIDETEVHDGELEKPIPATKVCFLLVALLDPHEIEPALEVDLW